MSVRFSYTLPFKKLIILTVPRVYLYTKIITNFMSFQIVNFYKTKMSSLLLFLYRLHYYIGIKLYKILPLYVRTWVCNDIRGRTTYHWWIYDDEDFTLQCCYFSIVCFSLKLCSEPCALLYRVIIFSVIIWCDKWIENINILP